MTNEDLSIQIDKYLDGTMSAQEKRDFDNQIQADASLQKEVQLQDNIRRAFKRMPDMQLRQHLDNLFEDNQYVFTQPLNEADIDPEFLAMAEELNGAIPNESTQPQIRPTKVVPLSINPFKKNRIWWAAAASIAVVVVAGIWWFQRDNTLQTAVVQTPNTPTTIDTLKKIDAPTPLENVVTVPPKNTPPQYMEHPDTFGKPSEKPKIALEKPTNLPISTDVNKATEAMSISDAAVFAEVKTVAEQEHERISEPTKGALPQLSREDQNLLHVLDALATNKPNNAIDLLKNNDSKEARYYRALAYLLTDRPRGKRELEALANDVDVEIYFRNKIKELLTKIK